MKVFCRSSVGRKPVRKRSCLCSLPRKGVFPRRSWVRLHRMVSNEICKPPNSIERRQQAISSVKSGPILCYVKGCLENLDDLIEHNDPIHPLTPGCECQPPPVFPSRETTFQTFSALIHACSFLSLHPGSFRNSASRQWRPLPFYSWDWLPGSS